jgi:type IV pilus assembly protein PilA
MKLSRGFTLIELMIVIAIIGILSAIGVPQYHQYTKRAKFSELTMEATKYKSAVEICYQASNDLTTCSNDSDYVPSAVMNKGIISTLTVTQGVIAAQAIPSLNDATFTLNPSLLNNTLSWSVGGSCVTLKYC